MTLATPLCALLGIDLPIVQAPIGSASTPELAAAVSEAGGLGMLAQTWFDVPEIRARLRRARKFTDRPVGVNLVLDLPIQDKLAACLEEGAKLVSTFWGDPGPVHERIRAAGALHLHTVGSVADAVRAAERGIDVVVAQGWEAGGHVQGTIGTMALVPAVVDAVAPVPVIAAGGSPTAAGSPPRSRSAPRRSGSGPASSLRRGQDPQDLPRARPGRHRRRLGARPRLRRRLVGCARTHLAQRDAAVPGRRRGDRRPRTGRERATSSPGTHPGWSSSATTTSCPCPA